MTVYRNWRTKLAIRRKLLTAARTRLKVAQGFLDRARKRGDHPREYLVKAVAKAEANVKTRTGQVHYAERIVARYKPKPLRLRAFHEAERLLGTLERGGNNRGTEVEKIIEANGGVPGEPWCGDFVAYCYRRAGSKLVTRSWAAVRLLLAGSTVHRYARVRRGDIVRYTFDHTGLFDEWVGAVGGAFRTIEGNTGTGGNVSDGVGDGVHRRVRTTDLVTDFRRVAR